MIVNLGGYAIPWNKVADLGNGGEEIAAPFAISPRSARNITLLAGCHDGRVVAQTSDGSLRFFSDSYGLGFSASLDLDKHPVAYGLVNSIADGRIARCSVNLVRYQHRMDAEGRQRLIWGTRPPHVRAMSLIHGETIIQNTRRRHAGTLPTPGSTLSAPRDTSRPPRSVVALMARSEWRAGVQAQRDACEFLALLGTRRRQVEHGRASDRILSASSPRSLERPSAARRMLMLYRSGERVA